MFVGIAAVVTSCGKSDDFVTPSPKKEQVATESMLQARNGAPAPGMYSIAQIAINNGSFNELVQALSYVDAELNAGQVDMLLNGNNQYTVFVPTGAAFNNLHTALNITDITDLPAALVLDVLKHHVVEGRRAANSVLP